MKDVFQFRLETGNNSVSYACPLHLNNLMMRKMVSPLFLGCLLTLELFKIFG